MSWNKSGSAILTDRKQRRLLLVISFPLFSLLIGCHPIPGRQPSVTSTSNPDVTSEEIISHIKFLASDDLKGRYPGTPESRQVMEYIAAQFRRDGILPAGDNGNYRQYFDFVNGIELGTNNSLTINAVPYRVSEDFVPLGFSSNGSLAADVVFVGYGFSISDSVQWDDYVDVDVGGKWVLVLRGGPEEDSPHSPYSPHLALRKKVLVARDKGAAGVLFVSQVSEEADELIKLKYDHAFAGAGIPVLHISQRLAGAMLRSLNRGLREIQDSLNESKTPSSSLLRGVQVAAEVELKKNTVSIANVVGLIPGNDPLLKDEYVVIGAHFDHLGFGGEGSPSLMPDTIAVHNGADDNASGVAGLLEMGQKLMAHKNDLKRSILLVCFDAEEQGTLGSKYFVNHPAVDLNKIAVMVNMDMVGRMTENKLTVGGTGTSPDLESILNEVNRNFNLILKMSPEGYGPSDHASFYVNDVPVLFFFIGIHEDYHKPSDDWEKINAPGEKQIVDFVHDVVVYLDQREEKPLFTEAGPKEPTQARRGFKVTFGVIPSYGSQEEGLEIDGVRKGGPADKAGMQKKDIIIEINGKEVKNIYDYMYRLGDLNAGETVDVKVRRGDEILILTLHL